MSTVHDLPGSDKQDCWKYGNISATQAGGSHNSAAGVIGNSCIEDINIVTFVDSYSHKAILT